jgi:tRNA threonylcarbamoyladenosine biosynthesis protein TsaE
MQTFYIESIDQVQQAAQIFLSIVGNARTFAFHGPMGSGKTTIIKAICKELGALDAATSPTFALVNEYHSSEEIFYHFDLYRIQSTDELFDIGYEEYFFSNHFIFIEWADKADALLPKNAIKVFMEEAGSTSRLVKVCI